MNAKDSKKAIYEHLESLLLRDEKAILCQL